MSTPGYVYVLGFSGGTVKVGRSKNGSQRTNAHKASARQFGQTVTDTWMSPLHEEWMANEEALKKIAESLGGTTAAGEEWFSGVDFAAITERAEELPFTSPEAPAPPASALEAIAGPRRYTFGLPPSDPIRRAALTKRAEMDAFRRQSASRFLDQGMTPEFARDELQSPDLADDMADLLRREAEVRQQLEDLGLPTASGT